MASFYVRPARPSDDIFGATQFYLTALEDALGRPDDLLPLKASDLSTVLGTLAQLEEAHPTRHATRVAEAVKVARAKKSAGSELKAIAEEFAAAWVGRAKEPSSDWSPPWFKLLGLLATSLVGIGMFAIAYMQWQLADRLSDGIAATNSETSRKLRLEFAYSALAHLLHASTTSTQEVKNGIVVAEYIMTNHDPHPDSEVRDMVGKGLCVLQETERDSEVAATVKEAIERIVNARTGFGGCQGSKVIVIAAGPTASATPVSSAASAVASGAPPARAPSEALRSAIKVACKFPSGDATSEQICREAVTQVNSAPDAKLPVSFTDPDAVSGATYVEFNDRILLRYFHAEDATFAQGVAQKLNAANVGGKGDQTVVQANPQYRASYPPGFFELWVPPRARPAH
jgi:hypothetical protein